MLRIVVIALVLAACGRDHGAPRVRPLPKADDKPALRGGAAAKSDRIANYKIDARLDPTRFAQVHRAHVVNLDHVRAFKRDGRGNLEAELNDGTRVPVSRPRAQELRSLGW